jgi:hypothetical protein
LAWIYVALLFGANLYFSQNSNLDDPVVSLEIPFVKDTFWVLIVLTCYYVGRRIPLQRTVLLESGLVAAFCVVAATEVYLLSGSLDVSYLKVFKNSFLYLVLAFPFVNIILRSGLDESFIRHLHGAMLFSLVVSLLFYFYHPVQSHTGRLFGTYGNPNTAGFIVVYAVALYFMLARKERTWLRGALTALIGVVALFLTASFSAIGALIALPPMIWIFSRSRHGNPVLLKAAFSLLLLVAVAGVLWTLPFLPDLLESTALESRIAALATQGMEHETVATRVDALLQVIDGDCGRLYPILFGCAPEVYVRLDSTITAFGYHFGVFGLAVLALLAGIPYWRYFSTPPVLLMSRDAARIPATIALLTTIVVFNFPIQHAFETFPMNFLFAAAMSILLFDLGRVRAHASTPVSRPLGESSDLALTRDGAGDLL